MGKAKKRGSRLAALVFFCALTNLSAIGCASESTNIALHPGKLLPGNVLLQRGHIFPYEAMSATSHQCALTLVHPQSGRSLFLFPRPKDGGGTWLDLGDSYLVDGQRDILHTDAPPPVFAAAVKSLNKILGASDLEDIADLCQRLDPGTRPTSPPMTLAWLGFVLVLLSVLIRRARPALASAAFSLGALSFLLAAIPVLLHLSYGSQEAQRLLSAALPRELLWQGHHGDLRHPRALFLVYNTIVHLAPSIISLRVLGFSVFVLTLIVWAITSWKKSLPSSLMALALLLHPCLLINTTEVGPLAFYCSGVLLLLIFTESGRTQDNRFFAAAMTAHFVFSSLNLLSLAVGFALILCALARDRKLLTGIRLAGSLILTILVSLPFAMELWAVIEADMPLRNSSRLFPSLAWGERAFSEIGRGLVLGVFGDKWVGWLMAMGYLAFIVRTRTFLNMGNLLVGLGLGMVISLALLSGTMRVQPAYAAYGVPLLFAGFGILAQSYPDAKWGRIFSMVLLLVMTSNFVHLHPALSRTHPGSAPAALVAKTLKERAPQCPTVLAVSHDLVVPLVPYLDDLSKPVPPPVPLKDSTLHIPEAKQRKIPTAKIDLNTLFIRHRMPKGAEKIFMDALEQFEARSCTHALYDTRMPMPEIFAQLERKCGPPLSYPPYALFRCRAKEPN